MLHARNFFLPRGDPSFHTLSAKKSGCLLVMVSSLTIVVAAMMVSIKGLWGASTSRARQ